MKEETLVDGGVAALGGVVFGSALGGLGPSGGLRMGLPENVYRLRVTDGHSVEQVSEATKVPVPVLSAIENGRVNVPPRVLKALSTHFGIPVRDLLK